MIRDELIERWVQQPPASPNVQYLRDAERQCAHRQLGGRKRVLDVASEATVTAGVDADSLTRIDFSESARSSAATILSDDVDRYEVTDPETPTLPFGTNAFDGAISIGPYDWKFLDIGSLTAELRRVITPEGMFTFSVPTTRSPYARSNWNRFRYFTPATALDLLSPGWSLVDFDLVFQYPSYSHHLINALPDRCQRPFVDLARSVSNQLSERERWERASYLVLGVRPFAYASALDEALSSLFRSTERNGFWDPREEKIVRALDYTVAGDSAGNADTPTLTWSPDDTIQWRYAPFGLLGAMQWRASAIGSSAYDEQLQRELAYFEKCVTDAPMRDRMPSYGIGPLIGAFALAETVFEDTGHLKIARELFSYSKDRFEYDHAEDCLLAYGWSLLYERKAEPVVADALDEALRRMNQRLDRSGLFEFDNPTTRRHQNQMYALWGFCRAISVLGKTSYLDNARRVLEYTIEHRMRADGAFMWEDMPAHRRLYSAITKRLGANPPHWEFLYECHQMFFVIAVAEYYRAGGERVFDRTVGRAMEWINGDNPLKADLAELSGIGVPMRQMTVSGCIDSTGQTFKGAYEIGAQLMALTTLLAGPLSSRNRVSGTGKRTADSHETVAEEPIHANTGGIDVSVR